MRLTMIVFVLLIVCGCLRMPDRQARSVEWWECEGDNRVGRAWITRCNG